MGPGRSGRVRIRAVLGCAVLGFFAFFVLAQLGWIQSPAVRKTIAAHREAALAQARRIEGLCAAAAAALPSTAPWDEGSVRAATGIPVTAANTAAMHLENLEDAARSLAMPVCFCSAHDLTSAASLARTGRWSGGRRVSFDAPVATIEEMFAALERLHYLIVVRKSQYVAPEPGDALGTFSPGDYRADAFLFELPTGRMLGSFPFGAGNSYLVRTALRPGESLTAERLEEDLASNAEASFQAALSERLPSVARATEP